MVKANQLKAAASKPWAGVDQPRTAAGKFEQKYPEPRGEAIALRLPQSVDAELRQIVGWSSKEDNPTLKAWVEAAILEKLERDKQKLQISVTSAHSTD